MRKLVASTVVLAILTSPAFAQKEEPLVTIERDKQQQAEALDKQYKKLMERSQGTRNAARRPVGDHARAERRQTLGTNVSRDRLIRFAAVFNNGTAALVRRCTSRYPLASLLALSRF